MPIENNVVKGVGTGIQPKDNPDPVGPDITAGTETLLNSLPEAPPQSVAPSSTQAPTGLQGGPGPMSMPQPNPFGASDFPQLQAQQLPTSQGLSQTTLDDQKKIDALFNNYKNSKSGSNDEASKKRIDALFDRVKAPADTDPGLPPVEERKEGEGYFQYKMKSLPQELQFIGAQMRAHLGDNPKDQRAAFEGFYGAENVKTVGKDLYFRPNPNDKFRKIDGTLYNGIADWMIFNSLNAIPMAANVGATTTVLGASLAGAPVTDGASLLAAGSAGAVGGAAEVAMRKMMMQAMNAFSNSKQSGQTTSDIAMTIGMNALMAPVGAAIVGGAKQAVGALARAVATSGGVLAKEAEAGISTVNAARVKEGFNQFVDVYYPHAKNMGPEELQVAFDKAEDRLQSVIDPVKQTVISMARDSIDDSKKLVPMDNAIGKMQEILEGYGYGKNFSGESVLIDPTKQTLLKGDVRTALDTINGHYNQVSGAAEIGGLDPAQMFQKVEELGTLSKFDGSAPVGKDARNLYRDVWKAHAADRDGFINSTLNGSGSPFEGTWRAEWDKYKDQIDSVRDFKELVKDEAARENLFSGLMSGNKEEIVRNLGKAEKFLEPDSKEWNGMQGQGIKYLVDKFTYKGVLKSDKLLSYTTARDNQGIIQKLFPDENLIPFQKMLMGTEGAETKGAVTEGQKSLLKQGVLSLFHMAYDPFQAVYNTMTGLSGSELKINYLLDKGFGDMIKEAEGPQLRANLMEGRRLMEGLTSKMRVVNTPSLYEKKLSGTISRYAPFMSTGGENYLNQNRKFEPAKAPAATPTPTPMPVQ